MDEGPHIYYGEVKAYKYVSTVLLLFLRMRTFLAFGTAYVSIIGGVIILEFPLRLSGAREAIGWRLGAKLAVVSADLTFGDKERKSG